MTLNQTNFLQNNQRRGEAEPFSETGITTSISPVDNSTNQDQTTDTLKQNFVDQFRELASDPDKFHELLKTVFGSDIDRDKAVKLRRDALQGDFSWLPDVEVVSNETLQNGNFQGLGAYNTEDNVIYLSEKLMDNPEMGQQVFHINGVRLDR